MPDFSVEVRIAESRPISALKVPPIKKSDNLSEFDPDAENPAVGIQRDAEEEAIITYQPSEVIKTNANGSKDNG